jgi:hypothetical protein
MLALAAALMLLAGAETKLYKSGCAPIDTPSAVMPLTEFRQVIANQETKIALERENGLCQDLNKVLAKQVDAYRNADKHDSIAAANWKAAYDTANANRLKVVGQLDAVANEARKTGFKRGFWTGAGVVTAAYVVIAAGVSWLIITVY